MTEYTKKSVLFQVQALQNSCAENMPMVERSLAEAGTEHTVALAFAERFRNKLKYDHHTNKWLQWNGQYWAIESTGLVSHYCRSLATEVSQKSNVQRSAFVKGVENFCKADPVFATELTRFDADNYLLNTPDGTYDLKNGSCKDHSPNDLIANITNCSPAEGYGQRFSTFLAEVTCGDKELERYLQVSLGSCLSGAIESHWLQFWIGSGRNGKNTLGDAVMRVMGSYARKIPSGVLMKSKFEGHPTEIANLKGCRLAIASEVDAGVYWSESKVNELTGDSILSARFMRGDFFQFQRTCKFLIYGNHRPRLSSVTPALLSRIKMIRFNADFTGLNGNPAPDPDLPDKLKKEDGHILRWLLDGHIEWINSGKKLPTCQVLDSETENYIESQATPENWMDECLSLSPPLSLVDWTRSDELFSSYMRWKKDRNEHPVSQSVWADAMVKRYERKRRKDGKAYAVSLLPIYKDLLGGKMYPDV
jgi:putative DNA primase/helicase